MQFTVTTVAYSDDEQNSDKFYRTYVGDNGLELRQNGRIGTTGAVAGYATHTSKSQAIASAEAQLREKARKGYQGHITATFDYPDAKLPTDKKDRRARLLFQAFTASGNPGSAAADALTGTTTKAPAPRTVAASEADLDALLEEVMQGINTAIADPTEGTAVYALLRGKIDTAKERLDQVSSYYETLEDLVMA